MQLGKEEFYTPKEIARLFGVGPGAIRYAITRGKLDAQKIGSDYFISEESLIKYIQYRNRNQKGAKHGDE